tara:strand:- start:1468 stop:2214 length:747 start_codon:yes stop_codon:yes gene_type:complete
VKEVALIANTPVPVVKEVKTTPTQVVIVPTKAPISASTAVTKTEVTPSPTPAAQPTMSSVSMTKSDETDSKQAAQSLFKGCEATAVVEQKPKSDLPEKEQIAGLSEIASTYFSGTNNTGLPRLKIPPDVRKSRRGGIVVNIEFNGDEYPTLLEKKAGLDCIMRDGYEVLYASGYEISEVTMTAILKTIVFLKRAVEAPIVVWKTRIKQDAASNVDWSKKNEIDFNDIWDTVTMHPSWKKELKASNTNK